MTMIQRLLAMMMLLALAACGGGGGSSGKSSFGDSTGSTSSTVSDLVVTLSSDTIPNSGAGTVTATVTALDANRNAMPNAAVTITANSGAILTISGTAGSVTDTSGRIVGTVAIGSDRSNRDITISATAGSVTRSAILKVVDSPVGNVATSIEVIAAATTVGTAGEGVQIRAFVKDASNNGLSGATVSFRADSGILSSVSQVTDASGSASATFSAGADKSNRSATITVSSGVVSSNITLPITGTRLTLSGPSSMILGTSAVFDLVVTDSRSNVVPNIAITAVSSLGNALVPTSGTTTNSSGQMRFTYTATNPGTDTRLAFSGAGATVSPLPALVVSGDDFSFVSPAPSATVAVGVAQTLQVRLRSGGVAQPNKVIAFAATGGTLSEPNATTDSQGIASVDLTSLSAGPVTVQATVSGSATSTTLPLLIVATNPAKLVLQITPTAVAPNASVDSGNQAQVLAKVTDAEGNPVQGQTVNFTRVTDPSGGNLLQASATTDASGQATVAYRPGSESTANNGVELKATVAGTTVEGRAFLTVNQTALFIALGTGNVIQNADPETYRKDWVVYVTDSNGIPVNGVTLTIKAIPTFYRTGRLTFNDPRWGYSNPTYKCRNEDRNNNGILDADEDDNGDGVLWPGNVVAVSPGNVQTVNGRVTISLTYAESYVPWVQLRLTASATVSGTESKTDAEFVIEGSSDDFTDETIPPAGVISPFGEVPTGKALGVAGACELV